jgi:hypothetical protein
LRRIATAISLQFRHAKEESPAFSATPLCSGYE